MTDALQQLLKQFAARWNLDELTPNAEGQYTLVLDDRFIVTLLQGGDALYLESSPGTLPVLDHGSDEPLRNIVRLSLAGIDRGEEVLSLAEDNDTLVLFRRLPANLTVVREFEVALESFVNRLEFWTRVLADEPLRPTPPALHLFFP